MISHLAALSGLRSCRFKGDTAAAFIAHLRGLPKRTVLLVDEAHLMPDASLEDLRLLTAGDFDRKSPFALVLVGQPPRRPGGRVKRRRRRIVRFPLPELSPREALALSYLIDRLDCALWDLYGQQMVRLSEREGVLLLDGDSDPAQTPFKEPER